MESNQEIVRQLYVDVISGRNPYITQSPTGSGFTQYTVSAKPSSLKTFSNFFAKVREAFPDYELTIDSLIVKRDRVMARYTICGTHKGEFLGISATNEKMAVTGVDIFRLENGKVVEHFDAAHQVCALSHFKRGPVGQSGNWRPTDLIVPPQSNKQLSITI
jgi:predicted ester cyclase